MGKKKVKRPGEETLFEADEGHAEKVCAPCFHGRGRALCRADAAVIVPDCVSCVTCVRAMVTLWAHGE